MKQIIGKRGTGKSTKLLFEAEAHKPSIVVCARPSHMREKAINLNINIRDMEFISYEQYLYGYDEDKHEWTYNEIARVYIDEIDHLLYTYDFMIEGYGVNLEEDTGE